MVCGPGLLKSSRGGGGKEVPGGRSRMAAASSGNLGTGSSALLGSRDLVFGDESKKKVEVHEPQT